ncbi:MAG: methylated-DNA--[protein]-cysteine S-methyltransferase [Blastochloris viridis]|uniref:methylated-DNA--[protein]-cysteine S-methyltransferase n=1 Tax=Blastochloris viridis TaxID=1079 RepID=A0A6N4RBD8_BLAVI|nr:MAG: methylated-DNA--[protein]-cysteine S-methyltransferase [Blastochloris viridis]
MKILSWLKTPLGPLWGPLDSEGNLTSVEWGEAPEGVEVVAGHPVQSLMEQYFAGVPVTGLPEHFTLQGTAFQQRVWAALMDIPYGKTVTYGELAATVGSHARAIGGAVGANPCPILVPCHRVMGAKDKMTGFSAPGGVVTKEWLLRHEGVIC